VWAVNQKLGDGGDAVGINLRLPEPFAEPTGWFGDIEAVVSFCAETRARLAQDFVIGVSDTFRSEDIIDVDSECPDVHLLKKFLGTAPNESRANDA
jgi:hypothetical protein